VSIARQRLGRAAESLAAGALERRGWHVLERNARTRTGELDLIALDGATLVFVEVKAGRLGAAAGPERPALAVGPRKQARLRRLAREWLGAADGPRPLWVSGYRFDVIGVSYRADGGVAAYEHIRDAF
jgi:putative endonuclease